MERFVDLSEREILALAIFSEEEDSKIYRGFAEGLREQYPASAKVFDEMVDEEVRHRTMLFDLYRSKFGDFLPLIRRQPPERLVFIDETWTKTNMAPLRGWAPRGKRLTAKVPHGHWKTTTFLAALRHDRIDAPWVLDGPIDGESFTIYVEKG